LCRARTQSNIAPFRQRRTRRVDLDCRMTGRRGLLHGCRDVRKNSRCTHSDHEIEALRQRELVAAHRIVGQHLAKQYNLGPDDSCAHRAPRWQRGKLRIILDHAAIATARTAQPMGRAMHLDHVTTAGRCVETVDILRKHAETVEPRRHPCQRGVAFIGLGAATGAFDLRDVLPGQRRITREHVARQRVLDCDAVVSQIAVVQPTDTAIRRQPRIRRHARPRNDKHATGNAHHRNGAFHIFLRKRGVFHALRMGRRVMHPVNDDGLALPGYSARPVRCRQS